MSEKKEYKHWIPEKKKCRQNVFSYVWHIKKGGNPVLSSLNFLKKGKKILFAHEKHMSPKHGDH